MRLSKTILATLLILSTFFAAESEACSCMGRPTPCEAYESSDAVFVGYVIDVKPAKVPEGVKEMDYSEEAYLRVEQVFKGVGEREVVFPQGTGGNCIPEFRKGERWLIYASHDSSAKRLRPAGCSRNTFAERAANDLMYLRNRAELKAATRLAGTLQQHDDVPGKGFQIIKNLAGIKISITDMQGRGYEAFSDNDGVYEITGLPAGAYRIHADIPGNLKLAEWSENDKKVELKDGGCAEADFTAHSDAGVRGRVIDSEGGTVPEICVQLIPAEAADRPEQWALAKWEYTDKEGTYEFKGVPPGKYLLGVNLDNKPSGASPFPRTFYPGVDSAARAAVIELGDLEKVSNYDIHLPPRLLTRVIEGVVYFSDGRPVPDGLVSVKESEEIDFHGGYVLGRVDGQGRFSLIILDGTRGWLHAYGGRYYANPLRLTVSEDIKGLKVIIQLPGSDPAKAEAEKKPLKDEEIRIGKRASRRRAHQN